MINIYGDKYIDADDKQYIFAEHYFDKKKDKYVFRNHRYFTKLESLIKAIKDDFIRTAIKNTSSVEELLTELKDLNVKISEIKDIILAKIDYLAENE